MAKKTKKEKVVANRKSSPNSSKAKEKIKSVMRKGYAEKLHSGSKRGPIVTNPQQMKAIAMSESRKKGCR